RPGARGVLTAVTLLCPGRTRLALALLHVAAPAAAQDRPCDPDPASLSPSRDLYCLELVPTPAAGGVSGRVELGYLPGPFTVAVAADGILRYRPTVILDGLPAPASLGRFTTYVAWAAAPLMYPVTRLGEVGNGRTTLPAIALEKFVILVTAEAAGAGTEPAGPIVLRGQSPSTRLQPPDLMQFVLGAMVDRSVAPDEHRKHDAHGVPRTGSDTAPAGGARWTTVPMPAGLQMLPAEMALRPGVAPYLPPAAPENAPAARPRALVRLRSGDTLRLTAGIVRRTLKGRSYTMYGFNGQYPGPLLVVPQGAAVVVELTNALDQPTTVHWHGVRLDNRFDGVPGLTQEAVPPGGRFTYHLRFPDAGIYWYHPHVREDVQQDLGLYGNLMVRSPQPDYFGPAHREEVLMLDDLLVGDAGLVPYGAEAATHALMGRFGNILLVNGEPGYGLGVRRGEVVRFFLTNVANTRTFNLSFGPGARLKVVAADVGNYAREAWAESVVIGPAERYVIHVRFDEPGTAALVSRVRGLDHLFGRFFAAADTLGLVRVAAARASPDLAAGFGALRRDTAVAAEVARYRGWLDRAPDRSLVLTMRSSGLPFVTRRLMELDSVYFAPMEWGGTMPMMNWASTAGEVTWVIRDPVTGKENMDIDWRFRAGDVVKLRLANERRSFHAMQHPIHLHGQRFLVLAVNGVPAEHHAWKDTVLLPAGATVDLLVEMSNPGRWMLHCHIAEHLSADMMMAFTVE
ncbi:MAG TPA: multicopper oxidase family protein, partial [Gemmatimonadaceae bacterium]|nr:multicopper oxidase family protein [Gemmatimonadaceae bacterium]